MTWTNIGWAIGGGAVVVAIAAFVIGIRVKRWLGDR